MFAVKVHFELILVTIVLNYHTQINRANQQYLLGMIKSYRLLHE